MTGFDLFKDSSSSDCNSFQCFQCDIKLTDAADALRHLNGHLPDERDDEDLNKSDDHGQVESNQHSNSATNLKSNLTQQPQFIHSPQTTTKSTTKVPLVPQFINPKSVSATTQSPSVQSQSPRQPSVEPIQMLAVQSMDERGRPTSREAENVQRLSSMELMDWTQNDSILSKAYDEWIQQFGEAECPRCPEVFHSKISWINHYIDVHQNHLEKKYLLDKDTFKSIPSLRNKGIDNEVARFVRNNQDFDFDLILTEIDDSSQISFDKNDEIPVSLNDEILSDPPSPIIRPSNSKRARFTDSPDDFGLVERLPSNDALAESVIADGILILTEDGSVADGIVVEQSRPSKTKRSRREVIQHLTLSVLIGRLILRLPKSRISYH